MATNTPTDATTPSDAAPGTPTSTPRRRRTNHRITLPPRLQQRLHGRRRYLTNSPITLTIIIGAVFLTTDPNTPPTPPAAGTTEQIAAATTLRNTITTTVNVPNTTENPTTETLVTPPGHDWWQLVTSMGPDTQLWDAPTPTDANWYALNTSKAYKPTSPKQAMNQTIHIGFDTETQAMAYRNTLVEYGLEEATSVLRGNIITLSPLWIDPYKQPYPQPSPELTAAGKATTPIASWSINYGEARELLLNENPIDRHANAMRLIYRQLGYTKTTHWSGTATNPDGPFTGTLADYNVNDVNMKSAYLAVTGARIQGCADDNDPDTCEVVDDTIDQFISAVAWYRPLGPDAPPIQTMESVPGIANNNFNYVPDTDTLPAATILAFGAHVVAEKGMLTGTELNYDTPVSVIQGVITPNGTDDSATLTIIPVTGEAQSDTELAKTDPNSDYYKTPTVAPMPGTNNDPAKPPKKPAAVVPEPDYTIDKHNNVVPNKTPTPTNKPPVPIPTGTPTNVPLPPIPTTVPVNPGTQTPDVAVSPE